MTLCSSRLDHAKHDDGVMLQKANIMDQSRERFLAQAEEQMRFSAQTSEYYTFHVLGDGSVQHEFQTDETDVRGVVPGQTQPVSEKQHNTKRSIDFHESRPSSLRVILQRTRPSHASGQPDALPFQDAHTVRHIFHELELPSSYFEIADGSPATARSHVFTSQAGRQQRFELVAHCITKQGDWAMALGHTAETGTTSVFWSVDGRIDSKRLSDDMLANPQHAVHPMLIPCIMFAATFRMAVERRHTLKERLRVLEDSVFQAGRQASFVYDGKAHQDDDELSDTQAFDRLFALLHSCRKDQASRKGRYDFWQSFHKAIEAGFQYFERLLAETPNESHFQTHCELKQWFSITWQRLESLMARDKDHIDRVDNLSHTLYNLVQQREIRLQSSIAQAAQRDSEGMKYIAILGSIFLPASLIATILNVPEFQFARGATLFGAYMGITIPFSAVVVFLCLSRPYWIRGRGRKGESRVEQASILKRRTSTGLA